MQQQRRRGSVANSNAECRTRTDRPSATAGRTFFPDRTVGVSIRRFCLPSSSFRYRRALFADR